MKKNNTLLLLFLLVSSCVFSQQEKLLSGTVVVKDGNPKGIHVLNIVNEKEATTDATGNFSILGKTDDVLVISSPSVEMRRKEIEKTDYESGKVTIETLASVTELDEVEIVKFDAVSLGILSKPAKEYTPAERRVYSANSTAVDALLNLISGRTKQLKANVKVEQKEFLLEKLDGLFEEAYYEQNLGISKERIKGFHYYLVENPKFANALNAKDKTLATFLMVELAREYNGLANDKK
ncbi:MAG: hypothetical protein CFE23_09515 [Flavobacterium sp. BFFFF1]|uniref:hypothetical protein n=1 Tax=Flavobacterium sp. BFFFF1 TaxID=2015557 RepID=UPI000BCDA77E|nr:hypothetical protein [Flavobacterium sp. BFFFF1]OYU80477.1 MAG: hypothetical protein CFE23_09515 [Flavobacterium sp. BFFFF1]